MVVERPGVRPAWVDDDLFPFESRFVEVDGCVVHYVDEGPVELDAEDAPTLLLLHGNPTWSFLYRDLIPLLSGRFRCVALDYPGMGLSSARPGYGYTPGEHSAVVEQVVDALGLRDVIPVVQDWGGPIGLGWAGRRPDLVRGLVVGNTWAWPARWDPWFGVFSFVMGGPLTRGLVRRRNLFVELMLPAGHAARPLTPEVRDQWRGPYPTPESREPTVVFPEQIRGASAYLAEVEQGLAALADVPALLVWGEKDPAFRSRERRRFQQLLPRAEVARLPRAGHFLQDDDPEGMAAAVLTWWSRATSGRGSRPER